ncbi:MAG TPA: hypothetical protein VK425_06360 [Acidimicrobiales bacterium]|nr:hypothetical protein [Acidimicrobiales bacterium]
MKPAVLSLYRPRKAALVLSTVALLAGMSAPAGAAGLSANLALEPAARNGAQLDVGTTTTQQIDGFGFAGLAGQVPKPHEG